MSWFHSKLNASNGECGEITSNWAVEGAFESINPEGAAWEAHELVTQTLDGGLLRYTPAAD